MFVCLFLNEPDKVPSPVCFLRNVRNGGDEGIKLGRRHFKTKDKQDVLLTGKLLPSTADMLLRVACLVSRTFFLATFSSLLFGGT